MTLLYVPSDFALTFFTPVCLFFVVVVVVIVLVCRIRHKIFGETVHERLFNVWKLNHKRRKEARISSLHFCLSSLL